MIDWFCVRDACDPPIDIRAKIRCRRKSQCARSQARNQACRKLDIACDTANLRARAIVRVSPRFASPTIGLVTSCNESVFYSATSSPVSSPFFSTGYCSAKSASRLAANCSNRCAWVSSVRRKPLETFRSLMTRARLAIVEARRAILVSECLACVDFAATRISTA
jgi:hypothetical protein